MRFPRAPLINNSYHNYCLRKYAERINSVEGTWKLIYDSFELNSRSDHLERNHEEYIWKISMETEQIIRDLCDETDES